MKITINIEKEHYPIEYEIDAYWQRSKTEYSEDEVVINIQENKEEDKKANKYEYKNRGFLTSKVIWSKTQY